jgi:hypothetical protein
MATKVKNPALRRRAAASAVEAGAPSTTSRPAGATAVELAELLINEAPEETRRLLSVVRGDAETLDPALWGPRPSQAEVASAVLDDLREQFASRRALELASVSRAAAADLLGKREQAVSDDLDAGRLVGFKRGRVWLLPAWQFEAGSERGVLPGLAGLQRAFPGGVVALTRWVTTPTPDLDDRSPRDAMAQGGIEQVLHVAGQLTAAGW